MRKYNIRGYNVNLGFDKKDKILYIKPDESNKIIVLYINTGNMLSIDALDIKFYINNDPNIMQPRKLQYLLSAAGIKKRDIIRIISAYNNPIINNKFFNTYKMSKCIMYYRMRMLEMFLKFTTRYKLSLLSKETILLMGFTRCEKYIHTHLGMMRGACYFKFTDDLNPPQTYVLGKTSVFVFDGNDFIEGQAKVLIPVGFNHKIIDNNHIIILERTYTTNSGYVLPVTVLKLKDTLNAELLDANDEEDIKNGVDRLYDIKYKNDIFII